MAVTKFGVVYSIGNGHIRRYIYPDSDAQLLTWPLLQGEALAQVSRGPYASSSQWQAAVDAAVTAAIGKPPGDPRCAVIDGTGKVVSVILADPDVDTLPGMTLVLSLIANIGWTWTLGGGFVGPTPIDPGPKP